MVLLPFVCLSSLACVHFKSHVYCNISDYFWCFFIRISLLEDLPENYVAIRRALPAMNIYYFVVDL